MSEFFNHSLKITSHGKLDEPKKCCSDHLTNLGRGRFAYKHTRDRIITSVLFIYFLLSPPHADSKNCGSRLGTDQSVLPQVWERTAAAGSLSSNGSCARCFFFCCVCALPMIYCGTSLYSSLV